MDEKEISLNFNFFVFFHHLLVLVLFNFVFILCVLHLFYSRLCYICIYIHAHTHTHTLFHTHIWCTRTDTFTHRQTLSTLTQGTSSTRYFTRSLLSLSLSFTHSLSLSRRSHPRILCCVLHQLPFCLIFNFSVRLNLHAWLLYVKSRTGAL